MKYMEQAVRLAEKAAHLGEVPVGCVIVRGGEIIAEAHNTSESEHDVTCHAEINAIKIASKKLGRKILDDCEMYVTLEPCAMCSGAVINSRIKRLYIGAPEPKTGCCGSAANLFAPPLSPKTEVYWGFSEDKCKEIMKKFFKNKR